MHVSVEALKFIDDVVRFDFRQRPVAQDLINHNYFKIDLKEYPKLRDIIHTQNLDGFDCYSNKILLFDTKKSIFGDFYERFKDMKVDKIPSNIVVLQTSQNVSS